MEGNTAIKSNRGITLQQKIKAVEKFLNGEFSQVQIAKQLNVSQVSVSKWCSNKEKLIEMLQTTEGKKQLRVRKRFPKKKKDHNSKENHKKQKRYHKTPVRYGFDNTEEVEEVLPSCNVFAYGDPFKTTASKNSIEILHENGYFVYPGMFSNDELENVRLQVSQFSNMKWKYIFNPNKKRLQCKEFTDLNISCTKKTVEFMKSINSELQPRQLAVLKTEEGAMRQYAHCDYSPKKTMKLSNEQMPLLALIPLENDTKLYVWMPSNAILSGKLTNVKVKPSVLTFNKGDLVIFTGNLIHAGAEWDGSAKYRLHLYFHNAQVPFPDNETWQVVSSTDKEFAHVVDIIDEEQDKEIEEEEQEVVV